MVKQFFWDCMTLVDEDNIQSCAA